MRNSLLILLVTVIGIVVFLTLKRIELLWGAKTKISSTNRVANVIPKKLQSGHKTRVIAKRVKASKASEKIHSERSNDNENHIVAPEKDMEQPVLKDTQLNTDPAGKVHNTKDNLTHKSEVQRSKADLPIVKDLDWDNYDPCTETGHPYTLKTFTCNSTVLKGKKFLYLMTESAIIARTKNCPDYFKYNINSIAFEPATESEREYPLAFSISTYHHIGILEQMIAAMFRPTDSYCIHVDQKATDKVKEAVNAFVRCYKEFFPKANIFVYEDPMKVFWGHYSVIAANLLCMKALRETNADWKAYINPAGSELPVRSISAIRNTLRTQMKGKGAILSYNCPGEFKKRFLRVYRYSEKGHGKAARMRPVLTMKKRRIPFNLKPMKGSNNVALARNFTDFLTTHEVAQRYYMYSMKMHIPDEHFFSVLATVNVEDQHDKSYKVTQDTITSTNPGDVCVRYHHWQKGDRGCRGRWVRGLCNFGTGDLTKIRQSQCLMANKFNLEVDVHAVLYQAEYARNMFLKGGD